MNNIKFPPYRFQFRQITSAIRQLLVGLSALGGTAGFAAYAIIDNESAYIHENISQNGDMNHGIVAQNNARVFIDNSNISTNGRLTEGVIAQSGAWVNLTGTLVDANGEGAYALVARAGGTISVNGGLFYSDGSEYKYLQDGIQKEHGAYAVVAENGGSIHISGSGISSMKDYSGGVLAQIESIQAPTTINIDGQSIYTYGKFSPAAQAYREGARIDAADVDFRTFGASSSGVFANGGAISIATGKVVTDGANSHGLVASGMTGRLLSSGTALSTAGAAANAVYASSGAQINLLGVTAATTGEGSHGLVATGGGSAITGSKVSISTAGTDAFGIASFDGGQIDLVSTSIATTGGGSAGIAALGNDKDRLQYARLARSSVTSENAEVIRATGTAQIDLTGAGTYRSGIGIFAHAITVDGIGSELTINAFDGTRSLISSTIPTVPVDLYGDVVADAGSTAHIGLRNYANLTGGTTNVGNFQITTGSTWYMTRDSDVAALDMQYGSIQFSSPSSKFMTLTAGSFSGTGGSIFMNVVLNEGGSATQSDLLHITGNVSGKHDLRINNIGGVGARTVGDGIKMVQVDGSSPADSFVAYSFCSRYGCQPVTAGAYEYLLYQGGEGSPASWYLRSELPSPKSENSMKRQAAVAKGVEVDHSSNISPVASSSKTGDSGDTAAYRPAVPGYALTPALNLDYGFATIGRLHERAGDIQSPEQGGNVSSKDGVWGRIGGNNLDADSGRFQAKQNDFFAQFGKDWQIERDATGGHRHAGATFTLGNGNGRFEDRARAIDPRLSTRTGSVDTQAQALGGYYTQYWGDGSYFDGVGQITRFSNKYSDAYGAKGQQDGYAIGISGEVGKPFVVAANGFTIEPQAQLMYQYLRLDDFDDQVSSVSTDSQDQLRGRIGVRLSKTAPAGQKSDFKPYVTVDVLHDFLSPGTTWVGSTAFERGLAKTWAELGLGLSGTLSKNSEVYANVKYAQNIGGDTLRNVSGNVGYRYSW
ncbi:MAG: autotransporter outer membrane beta-barrel domain-containing protein [Proteobacteria bacterium]|nr:autotransporter outer membrane beta-barrel domain-containing protein [Pseudomonadota bacterium]